MEGIHLLKDLLRQKDWMAKVDLKDAYFTVPIHKQDRDFLKFAFKNKIYRFKCLPFGLACAPWVFTKTLKPVAAQLRQLGVRLIVYIDDILILAETPDLARDHVIGLIYLLENLGFIVSSQKCVLEPTQKIDFLGFLVDSVSRELRLPADKIKKIRADLRKMLSDNSFSARKLTQMLGKLNAATRAIPLAQLFYRNLQRALASALGKSGEDYSSLLRFSEDEREELQRWIDHLSSWNRKTMLSRKPTLTIESDASRTGWGATCEEVRTGGHWSEE